MINFRYHVVTLVAVFLALGLGVLFGASFIDQSTVDQLQESQERLGNRNKSLRKDVVTLQSQNEALTAFGQGARDGLVRGALKDTPAVVLSLESTNQGVRRVVEQTLVQSQAKFEASLEFSNQFDLRSAEKRGAVAAAVQSDSDDLADVSQAVISGLTSTLAANPTSILQSLADAGLLTARQPEGAGIKPLGEVASPGSLIVIVPAKSRKELNERFTIPLAKSLASAGAVVAVVEGGADDLEVIGELRNDGDLKLVTVDGVEGPAGQTALAVGLKAAQTGRFGHYGTGEKASSLLP